MKQLLRSDRGPLRGFKQVWDYWGKAQQGYLWTHNPPEYGVLFDWHTIRANTCLDPILMGHDKENSSMAPFRATV